MSQRLFNLEHQIAKLQEQINLISEENSKLLQLIERKMTPSEKEKASQLHDKVSKAGFIDQYGKKKGEKVYYATMQKQAMKEAAGDYLPPRPDPFPMTPRRRAFQELDDATRFEREGRKLFDRARDQRQPQSPRIPKDQLRPGNSSTQTTRPGFRPPFTPKLPTTPLGRLGVVGAVAATAYGVGTAIDQIMHGRPGVPKDQLRPAQTEQLPSPESLYPAPSNAQSSARPPSGGQGSGGGLSG